MKSISCIAEIFPLLKPFFISEKIHKIIVFMTQLVTKSL